MRYLGGDLVDEEIAGEAEVCERGAGGRRGVGDDRRRDFEGGRQAVEAEVEVAEGGGRKEGVGYGAREVVAGEVEAAEARGQGQRSGERAREGGGR